MAATKIHSEQAYGMRVIFALLSYLEHPVQHTTSVNLSSNI